MNIDIIKESTIEYIENFYALSINYLKKYNNLQLKNLIEELEMLEDKIRISNELELNNYQIILNNLLNKIEGIINE